jgi:oligopeptide transport system substrate-binding protein
MASLSRPSVPLFLIALAALALGGCGKRETKVESGDRSQILHLGNMIEPSDLDPALVDDNETFNVVIALMEGLTQYDPRTCLPTPAVAERWEVSADNLTWTFHLRPEARWSNGDPVTAQDFLYAYRRMLSPGLAAEYAYMLFALKNGEAYYGGKIADFAQVGARAPDDHTLVLELTRPVPYLPRMLCHAAWYPVHRATIEKFGRIDQRGSRWTLPGNYVGNGPFVLAEWEPHQIIRATRSPTYWNRGQVRLNEIDFYPIEDNTTEEAMFRGGQLHITATMPIGKIAVYKTDPKLAGLLFQDTYLATYYYCFNVKKPPLDDVRVRRALAYAIDRRELVDRVALGGQLPAGHLTPPGTAGFTATAEVPSDPARARELLAQAGFPGGKGFPQLELLYNTNEGHRQIAEAIQQMWRRALGIDVVLRNEEAKVQNDTLHQHNFQISRYAWVGDYVDPSTFLDVMLSDDGNNFTGWKNAEYDRVVLEADHTADETRRFALYQRAEQILADECPIAPIYFYTRNNLRRPDVKGWYSNLLDQHPYTGVYLEAPPK